MKRKGFTLIELLIVITIIGILAVALLPKIVGVPAKGRDTQRIAHVNQFVTALETYYSAHGNYPKTSGCLDATNEPGKSLASNFAQGKIPADPSGEDLAGTAGKAVCTDKYYYLTLDSGKGYAVIAPTEADGFTENYYDLKALDSTTTVAAAALTNLKGKTTPTGAQNVYAIVYPL